MSKHKAKIEEWNEWGELDGETGVYAKKNGRNIESEFDTKEQAKTYCLLRVKETKYKMIRVVIENENVAIWICGAGDKQ